MKITVEDHEYTLVQTCFACPEQYDVLDASGVVMGYLRLRHGYFYASYPECNDNVVYEAYPDGDGIFEEHERERYLTRAVGSLHRQHVPGDE